MMNAKGINPIARMIVLSILRNSFRPNTKARSAENVVSEDVRNFRMRSLKWFCWSMTAFHSV